MNDLPQKQNTDQSIDRLVAQRRLYSNAKNWFWFRSAVALGLAIVGPLIGSARPEWKPYVALLSFAWLAFDVAIESLEAQRRGLAARIQELFDCTIYALRWNDVVAGEEPDAEDIRTYSKKATANQRLRVKDWYPVAVGDVEASVAVCICQRANVCWDSRLRRLFAGTIWVLVTAAAAFALAISWSMKVSDAVLALVPLVPLVKLLLTQAGSHRKMAKLTDQLKAHADRLIVDAAAGKLSVDELACRSRGFQDELFRHRKSAPPVPDFFYWIYKKTFEDEMNYSAASKVAEILSRPST